MSSITVTVQQIYEQIQSLPPDNLLELARYIEFLRFKADETRPKAEPVSPLRVVKLGGILESYDFSPELLAEVRREM